MSYDYDSPRRERSSRHHREVYDDRDPRYLDSDVRAHSSRDLVPRAREDSDLTIEEVRRDFPPPGHSSTYSREVKRRSRSADPGYDDYDDRRSHYSRDSRDRDYDRYDRDSDRRSRKESSVYLEEKEKRRMRVLSNQERIIAALAGAALAVGSKEIYDRREAKQEGGEVHRNPLASAALGAAGALAAYSGTGVYNKHADKGSRESTLVMHKGRDGQVTKYYSEEEGEDTKEKKGHKNFLEAALAAAGLGGAVKALTGGGGDDKDKNSDSRSRRGSMSTTRSKSRARSKSPEKPKNKMQQAAMASLIAGATEAFRVAKEPGGWKGEKAKRIFTAAAGAATIDAAQNPEKNQKLSLAESVIGGLVGNRVIHGSKKNIEEDKVTGRSRSRSRAPKGDGSSGGGVSGLAALATAGLGAFGAKKIMDSRKEKEEDNDRDRSRRRSRSDSRDGSPDKRHRSRSRSVVDSARRGFARLGIGNGPADEDKDKRSDYGGSARPSSRGPRRRRYSDEHSDDDNPRRRSGRGGGGGKDDYDDQDRYRRGDRDRSRDRSRHGGGRRRGSGSDTDLGDSDLDEKQTKRKRGKQILTIALASVATVHAANNVYQSMEKRNARHKAVREGRLTEEAAKKLKTKALLQDAAAVGIAAVGIKGAISEVKEAREKSQELKEWKEMKKQRRELRRSRLERKRDILDDEYEREQGALALSGPLPRSRSWSRSRSRSTDAGGDYRTMRKSTRADDWAQPTAPRGGRDERRYDYDDGPRYIDGNPYGSAGALPAPPVGHDRR